MHGRKDSMGSARKDTSLRYLMSNLKDFEAQETMLQLKGMEMGISMDRTPKCHCKLAGEGIEYAWGCAKNHYRRQPLKDKRGKDNFRRTVRTCFSREVIISYACFHSEPEHTFLHITRSDKSNSPIHRQQPIWTPLPLP